MTTAVPLPASISAVSPLSPADMNDRLLALLGERVLRRAAGEHLPALSRLPGSPQQHLWLGQLASEPVVIVETTAGRNPGTVPPAQGFSLRLTSLPATFDLTVAFSVYLALHPTVAEQRDHHDDPADTAPATGPVTLPAQSAGTSTAPAADGASDAAPADSAARPAAADPAAAGAGTTAPAARGLQLATVWTKVDVGPATVRVTLPAGAQGSYRTAEAELSAAIHTALRGVIATAGLDLFRPRRQVQPAGSLPRADDLIDERTWAAYAATNLLDAADLVPPVFSAALEVDLTADGSDTEVLLTIVNTTPMPDSQYADATGTTPYGRHHLDPRLYQVSLTATTATPLRSYSLEQVSQSYRYDRTVPAFGHNSPVTVTPLPAGTPSATSAAAPAGATTLASSFGAQISTSRIHPRTHADDGTLIDTRFATVIPDPIAALIALTDAYRTWVNHAWSPAEMNRLAALHNWSSDARNEAAQAATDARDELAWVQAGLTQLRVDPDLLTSFTLMNEVMSQVGARRNYDAWRPFQLAWIVGCLPSLVDPAAHPDVNIVWFATGGGKSEAYLGLMLVALFYARLTGTTAGSTVWARFPLRLLALQQTERFAEVVLLAERIRSTHPRMVSGDPFSVGFFVGSTNTPNRLYEASSPYSNGIDPADPALAAKCRVLEHCPVCDPTRTGPQVAVQFNATRWAMEHLCTNTSCPAAGVLPIWTIDDDIYRNAPAVLVGTVDKLAQLAHSTQFSVLLGQAQSRCKVHGYTASPLYCAVFGCTHTVRLPIAPGFTAVRLEIADELHLLDESLGALDGMYETLLQSIHGALGNKPLAIVAATATLEGFQNQVQHLYQRSARRFPVPGPTAGTNFWAYTSDGDPMRRYLGVHPRGITMVTAAREVAVLHADWLAELLTDPAAAATAAGLPTDSGTLHHIATIATDTYQVLLAYCLRKEDLSAFSRDDDVTALLRTARNLATIGGDVAPAVIREAVARLASPPADPDEQVRIIAATKAIGHGFDNPRLGVMVLMGTPTQAAEVIQATARVGRTHPGLVVHIFNPSRDRDTGVFRYYTSWIRYLDRLVHKVPVNRESLPVLRRVLSGALMAWLINVHDRTWLTSAPRRRSLVNSDALKDALINGHLDRITMIAQLQAGLGLSPTRIYHRLHRQAVEQYVDDTLAVLNVSAEGGKRTAALLEPPVPRSLRDVEEPIRLYGDI